MKSTSAYFYSVFATTLVLLVMGVVLTMAWEARRLSVSVKENLIVEVVLRDSIGPDSVKVLQELLVQKPFIRKATYVSKEEGAESLKPELGKNYLDVIGYNPLYNSFRVNLKGDYANPKSFERIQRELGELPGVEQVNAQKQVLAELDKTLRNFTFVGLIIGVIFLSFAVSLIFSSIKLDIYSRRQIVRTMQLFGASRWFIIRPYLGRAIINGLISGTLASASMYGLCYYLDLQFPALALTTDLFIFAMLFGMLIMLGIFISFFSTLIALFRYLNYKLYDLR